MQFEYQSNNLTLKILDTSHIDKIMDFYTRNRGYFDPYEADKPDNFYTREFICSVTFFQTKSSAVCHFQILIRV